jgi:ligand-binding sensor domain-containing protein
MQQGLWSGGIVDLAENLNGDIWFGNYGKGISLWMGDSIEHYSLDEISGEKFVNCMTLTRSGDLWASIQETGAILFNGEKLELFDESTGLPPYRVICIFEDYKGDIWFGTNGGGLVRFDGASFYYYNQKGGLPGNTIEDIIEDMRGNLWVACRDNGVFKFSNDSITIYSEQNGLSDNDVNSLLEDCDGRIWIGTAAGGVNMFDGKSFTYFTIEDGLANNYVMSLAEDIDQRIWVGTDNGLSCLYPTGKNNEYKIISFDRGGGLTGMSFYRNAVIIDRQNQIWWGTNAGVTCLDMNTFEMVEEPPQIQISRLDIEDRFFDFSLGNILEEFNGSYSGQTPGFNLPADLELPYRYSHLTFYFAAQDWSAPEKVSYSYRIPELGEDWSPAVSEAKADYRQIPYGDYTFEVRAIGEAQEWSNPVSFSFTILPPWYHTWWARTLYVILAILLIL